MSASIFDQLTPGTLGRILRARERRVFRPGEIVIHEGERVDRLYVIESGTAEVYLLDAYGGEHLLNRVGAGGALGEMSIATGQPASAMVRALTELKTVCLTPGQFREAADRYPQIHWNLTAILADRLARADHRTLDAKEGRVTVLRNRRAPTLAGYALACSAAWTAGRPVLHLVLGADEPPEDARAIGLVIEGSDAAAIRRLAATARTTHIPRAYLVFGPLDGMFASERVLETVKELSQSFVHIFLEIHGTEPAHQYHAIEISDREQDLTTGDARFRICAWGIDTETRRRHDGLVVVPHPSSSDEGALAQGVLPLRSQAGSALGRVARSVVGATVGLALGPGSWKGYAHVGVLRALADLGVPVDYVAGSSVGAVVATSIALGHEWEACADILDMGGSVAFFPAIPVRGLLSNRRLFKVVRRVAGEEGRIEDMRTPLAIVTADIETHSEVVFRSGLTAPALMASMSIPGVYPAMRIGPYTLVDGGVINPVPTSVVAAMGAHKIIAVRLSLHGPPQQKVAASVQPRGRPPVALNTILRSIDMMQSRMSMDTASRATITLAPDFTGINDLGIRQFVRGRDVIHRGEIAVEQAKLEISAAFPWLNNRSHAGA